MPPKKKKKTKEEEEAEAQIEEKRLEELKLLEEKERKKYEIVIHPSGIWQVLTEFCIENVWEHPKPKLYLKEFLIQQLKTMNTIANFEMIDIDILVEYNLYSIIFAKEKLKLDNK